MFKMFFKPALRRYPPMKAKRLFSKKRRQTYIFRVIAGFMVFCIVSVLCDMRLRPIIQTVGGNALKNTLSNVLDGTVNEMVDELGVQYGEMVNIERNKNDEIVAITLNTTCINGYKTEISDGCSDRLSAFTETNVPVPVGAILGFSFLNGRKGCIDVPATIYGFAVTDVVSKFESAGINQTRHTIYLDVEASAHAYIGLCHLNESVDETIILVETIIVGEVPNSYYTISKQGKIQ